MLAGTAYTRETTGTVVFSCSDGERFTVEYLRDHIRLRTGAGIFALGVEATVSGERYSDGQTVFTTQGTRARLERPGLEPHTDCAAANRPV